MSSAFINNQASEHFNKARTQAMFSRILNILNPHNEEMLSLQDVKDAVRPMGETYRGLQVVDVDHIVGSEGRYRDFNRGFLPKREELRNRWTRVDKAHLQDIILPPVHLYEIGGVYFVRDGNHRVSVARTQGMQAIDAEVISLNSKIELDPKLTRDSLEKKVIAYEKEQFYSQVNFEELIPGYSLDFTATGRYQEILNHIHVHKYFINQEASYEISLDDAVISWFRTVYEPLVMVVRDENLLQRFPGRTEADLYTWLVKHWHELKEKYGDGFSVKDAALDYSEKHGFSFAKKISGPLKRILRGLFRR
ncbi:MAG: transcriptional regulator [Spirochaetaceae bacterium]|nr:MAG: transcriptional regulator [Spirochaetaceae bacterium]